MRVSVLSGDGRRIYQLTSSAITYHLPRPQSWALRLGTADEGETEEGYRFQRLALYAQSAYALVRVDPETGEAWFKLYGEQALYDPGGDPSATVPLTHSMANTRLF